MLGLIDVVVPLHLLKRELGSTRNFPTQLEVNYGTDMTSHRSFRGGPFGRRSRSVWTAGSVFFSGEEKAGIKTARPNSSQGL